MTFRKSTFYPILFLCLFYLSACQPSEPQRVDDLYEHHLKLPALEAVEPASAFVTRNAEQRKAQKLESWLAASEHYAQKDYAAAITAFQQHLDRYPNSHRARFFLAASFLAEEQPDQAKPYLDDLVERPDGLYFEQAQWLRALVHVEQGELSEAKRLLHAIIRLPWHGFKDSAEELLPQIEQLSR